MTTRTLNADRTTLLIADLHPHAPWHLRPHAHIRSTRRVGGLFLQSRTALTYPHMKSFGATDARDQYIPLHIARLGPKRINISPATAELARHRLGPQTSQHVYQPKCAAHENRDGETDPRYMSPPSCGGTMDNLKFPGQCTSLMLHHIVPKFHNSTLARWALLNINTQYRLSSPTRHIPSLSS